MRLSASICIMLHRRQDGPEDEARAAMKQDIEELTNPLMADAKARGMKVEAYVEQLTAQEE